MPKGLMVVQCSPADPEKTEEFEEWYRTRHMPDVLALPGFVGATRYRLHAHRLPDPAGAGHSHLTVYQLDADDLDELMVALRAAAAARQDPGMKLLGTNPPPIATFYEQIED